MQLPIELISSLADVPGFDRDRFTEAHAQSSVTSIRLNPAKVSHIDEVATGTVPVPWSTTGFYLQQRPSFTFDPLFHAGTYYVQEASSMFLEYALRAHVDLKRPLRVLDCCAAPGGKSTHLQSIISVDSLLVSNEVIRSRNNILKENIIRWGSRNVVATNNDPAQIASLEHFFDVIVVDAPCSGSGLFRREPEAIGEWSEQHVELCAQRQQRIIADVWPALKPGGIIIYATCSYSPAEDESILNWMQKTLDAASLKIKLPDTWNITEVEPYPGIYGYRFWPHLVSGEGFFLACLQKSQGNEHSLQPRLKKMETPTKSQKELIARWADVTGSCLVMHESTVYAWPEQFEEDIRFLLEKLRVTYSGVRIGEVMREKLVPDHALALSALTNAGIPRVELNYDQVIRYLQRKDIELAAAPKGWALITWKSHAVGWVNILPGRVNNYYPKELRIMKEKP